MRLYGCGYNGSPQKPGIRLFDTASEIVDECAGVENPSYGVIYELSDGRRMLYAACEVEGSAQLATFEVGADGVPEFSQLREFEDAEGTCYVLVHP